MEYLIDILGLACIALLIVDLIDTIDTGEKVPQKPFKCSLCMGFWLSVVPHLALHGFRGLFLAGITAVATELIDRYLNR